MATLTQTTTLVVRNTASVVQAAEPILRGGIALVAATEAVDWPKNQIAIAET